MQQLVVLAGGAFTRSGADQHLEVEPLAEKLAVVLRNYEFDKQNPLAVASRGTYVAQDVHGVIIGPVVNHVLEYIRVAVMGYAFEERPFDDTHSVLGTVLTQ